METACLRHTSQFSSLVIVMYSSSSHMHTTVMICVLYVLATHWLNSEGGSAMRGEDTSLAHRDFTCKQMDESFNSTSVPCCCRVRCREHSCASASRACKNISTCSGYKVSADRTWATLKAEPMWWQTPGVDYCKNLSVVGDALGWDANFCDDYIYGSPLIEARGKGLIFDIGLGRGDDSVYYLQHGYDVVAVEADPYWIRTVERRPIIRTALSRKQIRILNLGIVGKTKSNNTGLEFNVHRHTAFASNSFAQRDVSGLQVRTTTCRKLIQQYGIPWFMKIDTELSDRCIKSLKGYLPHYVSTADPGLLLFLENRGYSQSKLVGQYWTRKSGVQLDYQELASSNCRWARN